MLPYFSIRRKLCFMKFFMNVCLYIVLFQKSLELSFGVLICATFPQLL